ncbi:alpha/beta hydrolase [Leucobacter sp. W1038]|uniref:alpha/beta hydrolase n=1 Tax=Leucobacter sp. W1038 TaxID=3438281 RepID=UPI003D95F842
MVRIGGIVATVTTIGLTLALGGCAAESADQGASGLQETSFPGVYAQNVEWQECGSEFGFREGFESAVADAGGTAEGARCALIEAPLDWSDSGNHETITLSAVHLPATGDESLGTLFSNPGGPGGSGVDFAIGLTTIRSFDAVHEQYDLLGFDPRGIGRSTPVQCENDTEIFELAIALCADANPLADSMGSAQVARDLELLRHLMGDEKTHYAGFSYGTVIGATYATLFPERLGRMMLDSAWPSDWSSPLGSHQQREAISFALNDLLQQCATEYGLALCPLNGEDALVDISDQLDLAPLLASDGTQIDGSLLSGYLTAALYQAPSGRQTALDVVGRSLSGEQAAIDQMADAMSGGGSSVGLSGMIVRCLSSPRDPNLVGLYEYVREHGLPIRLGGPEITDETLRPMFDLSCDALPRSGDDYMMFENTSDVPILVFGVTGDHATPYAGAQQMVAELGNARLLTLEGSGHIASYSNRSTCADDAATAYLLRGELPPEGTVCADD